jgi:hypothetical protein
MLQWLSKEMITATRHFHNQLAAGENFFGKILSLKIVLLRKKKTVTEDSFDWNLIFLRKTKKKKTISQAYSKL